MGAELSTPSQVGSEKHWSQPNDIREVRQREKAPKVNQGGLYGNASYNKNRRAQGRNEEGIKIEGSLIT